MATGGHHTVQQMFYPAVTVVSNQPSGQPTRATGGATTPGGVSANMETSEFPDAHHHENLDSTTHLTVDEEDILESETNISAKGSTSYLSVFLRWFLTLFVFVTFLGCLTGSKLSLIHLSNDLLMKRINHTGNITGQWSDRSVWSSTEQPGCESDFLMLMLLMIIPYATTLLRDIWCGGFRSDRPWPSAKALVAICVSCLLESAGISLFSIEVLSESPSYISVLLMNGVFLVPICLQLAQCLRQGFGVRRNQALFWIFLVALVLEVTGIILSAIAVSPREEISYRTRWEIPLSLFFLSISWCPLMQKAQIHTSGRNLKKLINKRKPRLRKHVVMDSRNAPNISTLHSEVQNAEEECTSQGQTANADTIAPSIVYTHPQYSSRLKGNIIANILKLIFLPGFCILYGYFLQIIDVTRLHSGFEEINSAHPMFVTFLINIFTSFFGYILGWMACTMCMWRAGFALPLCLATPLALLLVLFQDSCKFFLGSTEQDCYKIDMQTLVYLLPAALCLYLAQILSTGYFVFETHTIVMQKESQIFWLPGYNGIFLEQWMLLSRKNIATDHRIDHRAKARKSRVFICTTMYREEPREMEQLLHSISRVNRATQESGRHFESHIFFDNGVHGSQLTSFSLQLVSIAKKTLGIACTADECKKVLTPYGLKLTWRLPSVMETKEGMIFSIHLKDNQKVKNKKRWSQIMYMSYVLDFSIQKDPNGKVADEDTFILATDADVKFMPESVEALLDMMIRDDKVGAVCARTHPMGSGPLVWYQKFEYAVGHWLQKASNHVLGSVLCCPGCFSVYRVAALRETLSAYSTNVTKASEFLIKDMGEDRWLCTLMIQRGWRLEYCAAAEDSTYCPEEFDEFFKQRRRWIPSTLAHQVLLLQEWKIIMKFNKRISWFFMIYQAMLPLATLINPSVCILVLVGGLNYAWQVDQTVSTVVMLIITIAYIIVCLYASQQKQLLAGKILTILSALIMAAVTLGTVVQVVQDMIQNLPNMTLGHPTISDITAISTNLSTGVTNFLEAMDGSLQIATTAIPAKAGVTIPLPLSLSTLYLLSLVGIFVVTIIMHLPEASCVIHGLWYLLCLPAGNLILILYSICNITDRSWGTREEKTVSLAGKSSSWADEMRLTLQKLCFCCKLEDERPRASLPKSTQTANQATSIPDVEDTFEECNDHYTEEHQYRRESFERRHSSRFRSLEAETDHMPVSDWLSRIMQEIYGDLFKANGYDDTSFIAGMNDNDLKEIGISSKTHREALCDAIKRLPPLEIDPDVPNEPRLWLARIGLTMYESNFKQSHIIRRSNLVTLKRMSPNEIKQELGITKPGHLKRLLMAIAKLRYPTDMERDISHVKSEMTAVKTDHLKDTNPREEEFWEALRLSCLRPECEAFASDNELREKLTELRNNTLMVFAIINAIWLVLISTLASKTELNVLETNILGLVFLVMFGLLLCIQFLCMIVHRIGTWMHLIARTPNKCGVPYLSTWSFRDDNVPTQHSSGDLDNLPTHSGLDDVEVNNSEVQPRRIRLDSVINNDEHTHLLDSQDDSILPYVSKPM